MFWFVIGLDDVSNGYWILMETAWIEVESNYDAWMLHANTLWNTLKKSTERKIQSQEENCQQGWKIVKFMLVEKSWHILLLNWINKLWNLSKTTFCFANSHCLASKLKMKYFAMKKWNFKFGNKSWIFIFKMNF